MMPCRPHTDRFTPERLKGLRGEGSHTGAARPPSETRTAGLILSVLSVLVALPDWDVSPRLCALVDTLTIRVTIREASKCQVHCHPYSWHPYPAPMHNGWNRPKWLQSNKNQQFSHAVMFVQYSLFQGMTAPIGYEIARQNPSFRQFAQRGNVPPLKEKKLLHTYMYCHYSTVKPFE